MPVKMKVVVNCLSPIIQKDTINYLLHLLPELANKNPLLSFHLFIAEDIADRINSENIEVKVFKNLPSKALFFRFFKKRKILPAVRQINPHHLLTIYPLEVKNISETFIISPGLLPRISNQLTRFADSGNRVIVFSESDTQKISSQHNLSENLITRIHPLDKRNIKELDFDQREAIKSQFAGESEYFFCPQILSQAELTLLLKGFSGFKKWQKSNMKLVLNFKDKVDRSVAETVLEHYRFKADVLLVDQAYLDQILPAAYAAVFPVDNIWSVALVHYAMMTGVPVLCLKTGYLSEFSDDMAIFMDGTKEDITRQMLTVFKDEKYRSQIIEKGRLRSEKLSYDSVLEQYQYCIESSK